MRKYEDLLATGSAVCKRHGRHSEWTYYPSRWSRGGARYPGISCRICEREYTKRWNAEHPQYQTDFRYTRNGIISRALGQARRRAKEGGVRFAIDKAWFEARVQEQDDRCEYSGVPFDWGPVTGRIVRWRLPSVDRRTPGGDYTPENCALVCSGVNLMKSLVPFEEFVFFCQAVTEHRKGVV